MDMPWLKWWDGTATDPKFGMVAKDCGIPVASVIGVWAYMLEYASRNEDRGSVEGIDYEVMAYALQVESVETVCNAMKRRKIVTEDGHVVMWEKRQAKREKSEPPGASTKRVQALRERQKANAGAGLAGNDGSNGSETGVTDVTAGNGTKRPKRKRRVDKEEELPIPVLDSVSTATRLPDEWVLPIRYGLWAKEYDPGWSEDYIRELGEAFRDYWTALPHNSRAKKTNWFATWCNFLRQRVKPSTQASNGKSTKSRFWYGTMQGVLDKLAAEGMATLPGESLPQTVDRIIKKMEADEQKGEVLPAPENPLVLSIPLEDVPTISPEEAQKAREAAMAIVKRNKQLNRGGDATGNQ